MAPVGSLKEVVERVLAALALLVLSLVPLLVAWALVRAETTGPGLFRQQRVGRNGSEFTMVKFRTMTTTAAEDQAELAELNEVDGGVLFKIRSDPRVTRLGAILRRYSVDELPQLWNVVTRPDVAGRAATGAARRRSSATTSTRVVGSPSSRASPACGRCPAAPT